MSIKVSQIYVIAVLLGLFLLGGVFQTLSLLPISGNELLLVYAFLIGLSIIVSSLVKSIKLGKFTKEPYGQRTVSFDIFEESIYNEEMSQTMNTSIKEPSKKEASLKEHYQE